MKITKALILAKLVEQKQVLKPNQGKVSIPIIERICRKMQHKLQFRPTNVCDDNLIIDGHHRYLSAILTNFEIEIIENYPKPSERNEFDWNSVEYMEADWDSPSKIVMLNEEDARYNKMEIEQIEAIMKGMA